MILKVAKFNLQIIFNPFKFDRGGLKIIMHPNSFMKVREH